MYSSIADMPLCSWMPASCMLLNHQPLQPPSLEDAQCSLMWIYDAIHEHVCGSLPPVEPCWT